MLGNFQFYLKTNNFYIKTALAPFWATLVKVRRLLIQASGHTGQQQASKQAVSGLYLPKKWHAKASKNERSNSFFECKTVINSKKINTEVFYNGLPRKVGLSDNNMSTIPVKSGQNCCNKCQLMEQCLIAKTHFKTSSPIERKFLTVTKVFCLLT